MPPILIHLSAALLVCWRYWGMKFCQWLALLFFSCGLHCINNRQLSGVLEHSNNMIFIVVVFVLKRTEHALEFCLFRLLPCPLKHQFSQWFSLPPGVCQKEIYNFHTVSFLKCCVCSWGQAEYICALKRSRHGLKMLCVHLMYNASFVSLVQCKLNVSCKLLLKTF